MSEMFRFNKTTDEFIIESRRKFGDKFDYSRARYVNATKMIEFRCIEHDYTFFQTSNNHLNSDYPCEYCEREYKKSLYSMGLNEFKQRMFAAHGDVFSFENTRYVNQKTKIKIQCRKCNSPISSYPQTLINGVGCGTCYELKKRQEYSAEKLKEINKYVKKLEGKCLSNNYENNMTNLQLNVKGSFLWSHGLMLSIQ